MGYLTIKEIGFSKYKFQIPNDVIKEIYSNYFLEYISRKANIVIDSIDTETINKELLLEGKVEKLLDVLKEFLTNLSNRDYARFDEKYVKVIFYSICRMLGTLYVKSELEVGGKYADILLVPKEEIIERYSILIEFKYIKQEDYDRDNEILQQKQEQAKEQIEVYRKSEEIQMLPKLKCYSIVVIKDRIELKEI